jgi:hypothetical protein
MRARGGKSGGREREGDCKDDVPCVTLMNKTGICGWTAHLLSIRGDTGTIEGEDPFRLAEDIHNSREVQAPLPILSGGFICRQLSPQAFSHSMQSIAGTGEPRGRSVSVSTLSAFRKVD